MTNATPPRLRAGRSRAMVALLAVLLVLGACSDDDSGSGSDIAVERGFTQDQIDAALTTWMPSGEIDPYIMFASGGQGGQAAAGGAGGVNTTNATLNGAAGGGVGVGTGGNGGPDPNYDSAGGGGGGYTGGGGGSSTVDSNVSGAGGGGGSSWVRATSPTTVGNAPTAVSGSAGPASPAGRGSGATG